MKNEGVTILQIVITIIIMIILMAIAIFYGQGVAKEARVASIYNEIKEIESVLKEAYMLNDIKKSGDTLSLFGEIDIPKINPNEYATVLSGETTKEYYYMDFTTSRKLENALEIESIKNDYILDLVDLNIYLVKGIPITEKVLVGTDEKIVDTVKYNSDEISNYYNNTFVK